MNEQATSSPVSLEAFLAILRRRLWVIVLCFVVVTGAAIGFSLLQEERYSASATLLFRDPQLDQTLFGSSLLAESTDPAREAATNVNLVSLEVVANRTARELGAITGDEVDEQVEVEAEGQSDLVSVTATDTDPEFAATLANTFGEEYIEFRREADRQKIGQAQALVEDELRRLERSGAGNRQVRSLEQQLDRLTVLASLQTGNAELVQVAQPPDSPSSPDLLLNGVLGALVGLLLGIGLALVLDRLDRRIRDPEEVEGIVRRPVLGVVPESRAYRTEGANVKGLPAAELEAFGIIQANLRYFNASKRVRTVLVTSAGPGDGKTTVAWNLAGAAAESGAKVAVVEADLRRPALQERLDVGPGPGLSSVLAGAAEIYDATVRVPIGEAPGSERIVKTVDVIFSGPVPPNPKDLLESEEMKDLIRRAEVRYDVVFIDTPPISAVSDAIPLITAVNGLIVVSRMNQTTRDGLARLARQLENLNAPTLGVIVNSVVRRRMGYGYGYGYGYGEGYEANPSANGAAAQEPEPARVSRSGGSNGPPVREADAEASSRRPPDRSARAE